MAVRADARETVSAGAESLLGVDIFIGITPIGSVITSWIIAAG
ncbi:hypothetical protein [Mycolicibacterium sphagni]|jgi:hypothetical protein|nr:hypothetical protein [Mycolicibacterium sphagni]